MNKSAMKADFQDIFLAIYGSATGDVTQESDVVACGDVNDSNDVANATATDLSKIDGEIVDFQIGGTITGYIDYTTGGSLRKKLQLRFKWLWRCTYNASGVPSVNRMGGTYEWDEGDANTKAILLDAKRMGYTRA